jgi:hypothetical protein
MTVTMPRCFWARGISNRWRKTCTQVTAMGLRKLWVGQGGALTVGVASGVLLGTLGGCSATGAGVDGLRDAGWTEDGPHDAASTTDGPHDAASTTDASGNSVTDGPPVLVGRHAFVVTSTLTANTGSGLGPAAPTTQTFTLVLDGDQRIAIAGSYDSGESVPLLGTADGGFAFGETLLIFPSSLSACGWHVEYDHLTLAIDGSGRLSGSGQGAVVYDQKDSSTIYAASISIIGVPDDEPPAFSLVSDGDVTDPFATFSLVASEPIPSGVSPELISATGDRFSLTFNSLPTFVVAFQSPPTLLRFGEVYTVSIDGISDFAGNAAVPAGTLGFTTKPAPPLVAPDGFESVTSDTLGGAQILSGTGAPIIDGTQSLYVAPVSAMSRPRITQLALRLALAPGDTVVHFTYQVVSPELGGGGTFSLGSVGGTIVTWAPDADSGTTSASFPGGAQYALGPVATASIALPPDAAGEVVLALALRPVASPSCTGTYGGGASGIIIDDLQTE